MRGLLGVDQQKLREGTVPEVPYVCSKRTTALNSLAFGFLAFLIACGLAPGKVFANPLSVPPVASPYRSYFIQLQPFVAATAGPSGLLLRARVDGGPPLRLLLDTGAQYLVLDRKAAARSGHTQGDVANIVGMEGPPKPALQTLASTVEVDGLVLHQSPLLIVDDKMTNGVDGVIPLSMFAAFLIHLDMRNKTLHLEPYSADRPSDADGFVKMKSQHNLLFLETRLGDSLDGYLLLDTGSASNLISTVAAEKLNCHRPRVGLSPLVGGAMGTLGSVCRDGVSFLLGASPMTLENLLAVDFTELSKRHRLEFVGVIGFPWLSEYTVTVDYRDAMVRMVKSPARSQQSAGLSGHQFPHR